MTYGCASLTVLTGYGVFRALAPALRIDDALSVVVPVAILVALSFPMIWLAWIRKGWARYLIPTWFLLPIVSGALIEAPMIEVSPATLLFNRLVFNWLYWAYLLSCFALFLPSSNNWYRGLNHAAS